MLGGGGGEGGGNLFNIQILHLLMNQQEVWNKIAPEWHEYKTKPAENTIKFLKSQSGKILDLGSGSGRNLTNIKDGKMYLIDFSKEMINLAEKRAKSKKIPAEFYISEITRLPFKDSFFDSAICTHSLYCIKTSQKREQTAKELYRVLKKGAKALISVWDKNSERFKNSEKEKYIKWTNKGKRYYYLYDEKEVHDLFDKIGFKIIKKVDSNINITFIAEK